MSVRFKRTGTTEIKDHNELINRGIRTHEEIDRYLDELDVARGIRISLNARFEEIEEKNAEQDILITRLLEIKDEVIEARGGEESLDARLNKLATNTYLRVYDAKYDGLANRIVVTILEGRASINGTTVFKTETEYVINSPVTNVTYYIFLREDGEFYYSTSQEEERDSVILGSVKVGNTLSALEVSDLRYLITKGGGGSAETSLEVIEARTDLYGVEYPTLKERLDAMQKRIGSGGGGTGEGTVFFIESLPYTREGPQREFVLPDYEPGTHQLEVYVEGVRMFIENGDYIEKDKNTVVFSEDIPVDYHVAFIVPEGVPQLVIDGINDRIDKIADRVTDLESRRDDDLVERVKSLEEEISEARGTYATLNDRLESSVGGGGGDSADINQVTKLNITASVDNPYIVEIPIEETVSFRVKTLNVLRFVPGEEGRVQTEFSFDNADRTSFEDYGEQVIFDGTMRLSTQFTKEMEDEGELGKGRLLSVTLTQSDYRRIEKVEVI